MVYGFRYHGSYSGFDADAAFRRKAHKDWGGKSFFALGYTAENDPLGVVEMSRLIDERGDGVSFDCDYADYGEAFLPFSIDAVRALTKRVIDSDAADFRSLVWRERDKLMERNAREGENRKYSISPKLFFDLLDVYENHGEAAMIALMGRLKYVARHLGSRNGILPTLVVPFTADGLTDDELLGINNESCWAVSRFNSWFAHIPGVDVEDYPWLVRWTLANSSIEGMGDALKNQMKYRRYGIAKKTLLRFIVDAEKRGGAYGRKAYEIISDTLEHPEQDMTADTFTVEWLESVVNLPTNVVMENVSMDAEDTVVDWRERYDAASERVHRVAPVFDRLVLRPTMNEIIGYDYNDVASINPSITHARLMEYVRTCEQFAESLEEWSGAGYEYIAPYDADGLERISKFHRDYPQWDIPVYDPSMYSTTKKNAPVTDPFAALGLRYNRNVISNGFRMYYDDDVSAKRGTLNAVYEMLKRVSTDRVAYRRLITVYAFIYRAYSNGVSIEYRLSADAHPAGKNNRFPDNAVTAHHEYVNETVPKNQRGDGKITAKYRNSSYSMYLKLRGVSKKTKQHWSRRGKLNLEDYDATMFIGAVNPYAEKLQKNQIYPLAKKTEHILRTIVEDRNLRKYVTMTRGKKNQDSTLSDYTSNFIEKAVVPFMQSHDNNGLYETVWLSGDTMHSFTVHMDDAFLPPDMVNTPAPDDIPDMLVPYKVTNPYDYHSFQL